MDITSPDAVLAFWLDEADADAAHWKRCMARWFAADAALDDEIVHRFGATLDAARAGELDAWTATPRGWLGLLIVLDQFSRNAFRGTAAAFTADEKALELAIAGIDRGDDQRVAAIPRLFCYLPFEHAEDNATQERSVALFSALHAATAEPERALLATTLDYARRHAEVIRRFGRFPHRNAVLGRVATPAEVAWLEQYPTGF